MNLYVYDMYIGSPGGKYSEKKVGATQAEAITDANEETAERLKKAARVLVNSQPVSIFFQIFFKNVLCIKFWFKHGKYFLSRFLVEIIIICR